MRPIILIIYVYYFFSSLNATAQDNRTYADYKLEIVQDILLSDFEIYRPNLLDVYKGNKAIFFDFASYNLIVFDMKSGEFNYYGNRGKGPKEFGQIFDLKVDDDGVVYLLDTGNNKMIKWHHLGDYREEVSVGSRFIRPARVSLCKGSNIIYVLSSQYGKDGLLHKYNKSGDLKTSFHQIDGNKERSPYYTDGKLACDDDGNVYYAKRYVNDIFKFNNEGERVYTIPVFDTEKFEDIDIVNGKFYALNPAAPRYSSNIYYLNDKLYVSYSGLPKNFRYRFIDVYSEKNQEYLHSIKLPFEFREFVIDEESISIFREDESGEMYLTIFNYKFEE